ncbi:Derlin-2 [Chytridiales sp. JEL 0842]|nr:Derlin-2 [Chytridiales sp. JEL 0842]
MSEGEEGMQLSMGSGMGIDGDEELANFDFVAVDGVRILEVGSTSTGDSTAGGAIVDNGIHVPFAFDGEDDVLATDEGSAVFPNAHLPDLGAYAKDARLLTVRTCSMGMEDEDEAVFVVAVAEEEQQLDILYPFQLHFSYDLVFKAGQYWRLLTSFLYFGNFSIDFLFHMFFMVRYARMLEEGYFRGRTADFLWLFMLGAVAIVVLTPLFSRRSLAVPFLSSPLSFMLVYLWSRQNRHIRMNFLGLFSFNAPALPLVLLGFSLLLHGVFPTADVIGLVVGHIYYFLDDVWPRAGVQGGDVVRPRLLRAPKFFVDLLEGAQRDGRQADLPRVYEEMLGGGGGGQNGEGVGVGVTPVAPSTSDTPTAAPTENGGSSSSSSSHPIVEKTDIGSSEPSNASAVPATGDGSSTPSSDTLRARQAFQQAE